MSSNNKKAIIIGAGMNGLATAWHLQEYGYDVEVIDRNGVAAGSSWGNAGYLTPAEALPLAETSLWSYGPQALLDPSEALAVPPRWDPRLWLFFGRFMAHATPRGWERTMSRLAPINREALAAYDELVAGGVEEQTHEVPFVIALQDDSAADDFLSTVKAVRAHGINAPVKEVSLDEAREHAPILSENAKRTMLLGDQRYIEPGHFVRALADSVEERGGVIRSGVAVADVKSTRKPSVKLETGEWLDADDVVIATGAWLPELARELGVTAPVKGGRGYSFSVAVDEPVTSPVYMPGLNVACTPYEDRFRVTGVMEFRGPDEAFQPARIDAIVTTASPMFRGIDWDSREDEWVGARPVTTDGVPLIGKTKAPHVYTCGGHGMWGVVLGPVSGKLLAKEIATGERDDILTPFDPLRGPRF